MSEKSCESLHTAIRKALEGGDFDAVRQMSTALGQAIICEAQVAAPSKRKQLVEDQLNRLREHLSLARVLRAHVASHLQANSAVSLYQQSPGRGHSWRFDG